MKSIIVFILILFAFVSVDAQRVFLIKSDTLKGADTLTFRTNELTSKNELTAIQAECIQLAGSSTADSIICETSITGNYYASITGNSNNLLCIPANYIPITDGATILLDVVNIPNTYFGFKAYGIAGDTTIINTYGLTKK